MALTIHHPYSVGRRLIWVNEGRNWVEAPAYYGTTMAKKIKAMAKAFDVATCKNGHPRYIISRSVKEGARVGEKDFVPIGDSPQVTISVQLFDMKCPECGAKVFEPTDDGNYGLKFYNRGSLVGEGKYVDDDTNPVLREEPAVTQEGSRKDATP